MKDYLKRFRSGPGWEFFTGTPADIRTIRTTFDLHVPGPGPSMPLSFIRSPKDGKWVRLSGSRTPAELVDECRKEGIL
jgi:protein SCO1/2